MKRKSKFKNAIRLVLHLERAVKLVWKAAPGWTLINISLVIVQSLLPLAALFLMKQIVDAVTTGVTAPDKSAAFNQVIIWILLAAAIAILTAICSSLSSYSSEVQSLKVTDNIFDILHARSVEVDLGFYEDPTYFNTLHRAQREAPYRPTRIVNGLIEVSRSSLSLVGIMALLFSFNWWIGILLFFAAFPSAIVKLKFSKKLFGYEEKYTETDRRSWYYHSIMTDPIQAREVRIFNLGNLFITWFRKLKKILRQEKLAISKKRAFHELGAQVLTTATIFATFGFICYETLIGIITLGSMVMYYQGFQRGLRFLQSILRSMAGLYEDNLFLTQFYKFLDLKPGIKSPENPLRVPDKGIIDIKNVSFSYPGCSDVVLSDLSIFIPEGSVVAIIGENGSGKTTLVKLLCRLYDPCEGRINYDNIDLRHMDPTSWRSNLSVIFQDYIHYNLTAAENIWIGDVKSSKQEGITEKLEVRDQKSEVREESDDYFISENTMKDIIEAAKLSGVEPVIRKLPLGFNTQLGRVFENGHELSIGEWQKIALARAFYRSSNIVILDEPTSSLDPLAEARIFQHFRKLIQGKTAILISHRFSTVRIADLIFVMDKGNIIEHGSHQELIGQNGHYAKMYTAQVLK